MGIDGLDRLAPIYEPRDDNKKAAAFAQSNPGFDRKAMEWQLSQTKKLESAE